MYSISLVLGSRPKSFVDSCSPTPQFFSSFQFWRVCSFWSRKLRFKQYAMLTNQCGCFRISLPSVDVSVCFLVYVYVNVSGLPVCFVEFKVTFIMGDFVAPLSWLQRLGFHLRCLLSFHVLNLLTLCWFGEFRAPLTFCLKIL